MTFSVGWLGRPVGEVTFGSRCGKKRVEKRARGKPGCPGRALVRPGDPPDSSSRSSGRNRGSARGGLFRYRVPSFRHHRFNADDLNTASLEDEGGTGPKRTPLFIHRSTRKPISISEALANEKKTKNLSYFESEEYLLPLYFGNYSSLVSERGVTVLRGFLRQPMK